MRAEYDFSGGVRGKYYQRYMQRSNVGVLKPDVHKRFKKIIRAERTQRGLTKRSTRTRAKAARAGNR